MAKGMMIVDGQRVNFDGEKNVLSVIRKAGIEMPTFCYYSDLSVYGACRMCVVEDEKTGKIDASCSMEPRDGMRISTNSARLLKHRRVILELLLASHNCNCTTCEKSGHCRLQELAQQFGVRKIRFPDTREHYEIDSSSPAVLRDPNKCILCGDCVRVCEEMQGMGILNFAYRGSNLQVMPAFDRKLAETKCVSCGQCAAVCTTGAITVKNQIGEAWRAIHDPSKRVVIQIAPAVRVAVGEAFGFPAGENVLDKLVTALKLMGVDEVYDTTFGATYDDRRIRRIPRTPEKRRSVPDVHLLLPGVGEVSRKREPQVFEEHFDLQVADGDGRRDLPRQVCREGRCRRPHDLSHRHHALHGEEDGGRAPRVHPRRSTRRRPCAHHARGDRHDAGDGHPARRAGA